MVDDGVEILTGEQLYELFAIEARRARLGIGYNTYTGGGVPEQHQLFLNGEASSDGRPFLRCIVSGTRTVHGNEFLVAWNWSGSGRYESKRPLRAFYNEVELCTFVARQFEVDDATRRLTGQVAP